MTFATGLLIGLFVGAITGIMILSLMVISRQGSEREQRMH
jgi:hypothetical protein